MVQKVWVSFSSGKDSMLSLYYLLKDERYKVEGLFITYNQENNRVSMHGVSIDLIQQQAQQLNLPLKLIPLPAKVSHQEYSEIMAAFLEELKQEEVRTIAFGDIFLEDLKAYRIQNLETVGMQAIFPLWGIPPKEIIDQIVSLHIKTMMVAIDARKLSEDFLGKTLDYKLIASLPQGVDVCGENGEFHTFVYDAPFFAEPIKFKTGEIVTKIYEDANKSFEFKFLDLMRLD